MGKLLAELTPGNINTFFFTLGGAEANENAIRMARLYTGRQKILSRYRSYHGATNATMQMTGDPRRWPSEPGGPGFIRGTHTAWRSGKYVFVGDEVFSAKPIGALGPIGLGRAYGRLHVVDVSDITKPRIVAYYEPKDGGTHNVWVAGDTLYLGDYQGGLRVVDISGELRGNLLEQGREIAHVATGDAKGFVPNAPLTWGAIYRNGYVYSSDMNSGLWVVKVEQGGAVTP